MSNQEAETIGQAGLPQEANRPSGSSLRLIGRYGIPIAMVVTFAVFSLLKPDAFFTLFMMKSILRDSAPLMIAALGVTFVLVMNDYDISLGGLTALLATCAVLFVSTDHANLGVVGAVVATIALGGALAFTSGLLISYAGLPSFILTIAMGTVFTGIGLQLTGSRSIYGGVPEGYAAIAGGNLFGLSNQVFIGLGVLVLAHLFLRHSEAGRYMYAIGGNAEAARLSGVPVKLLKAVGFGMVGLAAAITAILLTSQANAANPNTGLGLLLPAYAAAFLGSSMFRSGSFTALGTALAALYLQVIGAGLTILSLSGPLTQIIQGLILAAAIGLSRFNRQAAR
ncbi:MAG: ABC transporter permease [Rhizobiaceae bacterium]|nr:ABC transporter permease [Rhizobiaceae bacterium]